MYVRNFTHSWFIQIKIDLPEPIQRWFFTWWTKFGISHQILPEDKKIKYNEFIKSPTRDLTTIEKDLLFFFKVRFPWIINWEFKKTEGEHKFPVLSRIVKIKWWKQYDDSKLRNSPSSSTISQKLSRLQELEEIKRNLEKAYKDLQSTEDYEYSPSP